MGLSLLALSGILDLLALYQEVSNRASNIAQQVKVHAAKPNDLNSLLRAYMTEKGNSLLQTALPQHTHTITHTQHILLKYNC